MEIVSLDKIPILPKTKLIPEEEDLTWYDASSHFYQMRDLCRSLNGVGLHAVQVGLPYDMFVATTNGFSFDFYVSCSYEGIGEKIDSVEGCLSILDENNSPIHYKVKRFNKIIVSGYRYLQTEELVFIEMEFQGFPAIIMQHEIDHGDNILISNIGELC